jgi:hypothetical protein
MKTIIKAKKDLFNNGLCFSKGKLYVIDKQIHDIASLMDVRVKNDRGEDHIIGSWWREFEIVEAE